ncbi:MAG: alpha/beta hydrolase [Acidobacteriia bacterium]|nr:alpha/beta hydrolase [Terriglobia bacterium]
MTNRFLLLLALAAPAFSQLTPAATWATHAANEYQAYPNLTYVTASGIEQKLDIYKRRDPGPHPTLIYYHGGFWAAGNKEGALMTLMPWFEMGWNEVNVEYRLARVALAPAAVEDCLCALKFVVAQAKTYDVDVNRIVVTGESAGGHLALTTGMVPASTGLDNECTGPRIPKVAAIINWFGITDVNDVIDGPNRRDIAATWLGSLPDRVEIARRVSPLTYVRAGLPPILTVHGDADPTVPYPEAVSLHKALDQAGVPNQLVTVPGGKHGNFTPEERTKIFLTIREFLAKNGLAGKS